MKISAKFFLEHDDEFVFGPGRLQLLKAVHELGSLRKAAQSLGMSYRWAWGRLNNAEKELQVSLMTRTEEAVGGRPKVLTPEAHHLLEWFTKMEAVMQTTMDEVAKTMPEFLSTVSTAMKDTGDDAKVTPQKGKRKKRVTLDEGCFDERKGK